jgi:hypothetical protein
MNELTDTMIFVGIVTLLALMALTQKSVGSTEGQEPEIDYNDYLLPDVDTKPLVVDDYYTDVRVFDRGKFDRDIAKRLEQYARREK